MNNPDDYETTDNLPFTSSGVVDVNNIAEIPNATTLTHLAQLVLLLCLRVLLSLSQIIVLINYH